LAIKHYKIGGSMLKMHPKERGSVSFLGMGFLVFSLLIIFYSLHVSQVSRRVQEEQIAERNMMMQNAFEESTTLNIIASNNQLILAAIAMALNAQGEALQQGGLRAAAVHFLNTNGEDDKVVGGPLMSFSYRSQKALTLAHKLTLLNQKILEKFKRAHIQSNWPQRMKFLSPEETFCLGMEMGGKERYSGTIFEIQKRDCFWKGIVSYSSYTLLDISQFAKNYVKQDPSKVIGIMMIDETNNYQDFRSALIVKKLRNRPQVEAHTELATLGKTLDTKGNPLLGLNSLKINPKFEICLMHPLLNKWHEENRNKKYYLRSLMLKPQWSISMCQFLGEHL